MLLSRLVASHSPGWVAQPLRARTAVMTISCLGVMCLAQGDCGAFAVQRVDFLLEADDFLFHSLNVHLHLPDLGAAALRTLRVCHLSVFGDFGRHVSKAS